MSFQKKKCSLTSQTHQTSKGLDRRERKKKWMCVCVVVVVGGGGHEDVGSEVGEYALIRSVPRSTFVSLYIHNISLHIFNLPISKTLSVHPDGARHAAYSFVAFSSKWWKVRGKSKTKCRAKKWVFNICSYPLNEIQSWWLWQKG